MQLTTVWKSCEDAARAGVKFSYGACPHLLFRKTSSPYAYSTYEA